MSGYTTSLTRLNHLRLADDRALEEEAERYNPVNPVRNPVIRGGFATPSFGTSQFVGGNRMVGGSIARDARLTMANNRATDEEAMRMNPLRKSATPTTGVSQVRGGKGKCGKGKKGGATLNELADLGNDELKVHKKAHRLIGGFTYYDNLLEKLGISEEEFEKRHKEEYGRTVEETRKLNPEQQKARNEILGEKTRRALVNKEMYEGKEPITLNKEIAEYERLNGSSPTPEQIEKMKKNIEEHIKRYGGIPGRAFKYYGPPGREGCLNTYDRAVERWKYQNNDNNPSDAVLKRIRSGYDENGLVKPYVPVPKISDEQRRAKAQNENPFTDRRDKFEQAMEKFGNFVRPVWKRIPVIGPITENIIEGAMNIEKGQYVDALDNAIEVGKTAAELASKPSTKKQPTAPARERPNYNEDLGDYEVFNFDELDGEGRKRMTDHTEAKEMGRALSNHLKKLHGGAYASAFATGMSNRFSDELKPELAGKGKTGRYEGLGYGCGDVRDSSSSSSSDSDILLKGKGKAPKVPAIVSANVSGGRSKRAPSKRNEIVKKVMREKGLSMIEASSYVKEHNLYKP